jgi:hypothetical protein
LSQRVIVAKKTDSDFLGVATCLSPSLRQLKTLALSNFHFKISGETNWNTKNWNKNGTQKTGTKKEQKRNKKGTIKEPKWEQKLEQKRNKQLEQTIGTQNQSRRLKA